MLCRPRSGDRRRRSAQEVQGQAGSRRPRPHGAGRDRPGDPRPQRRRQDHGRPHHVHPAARRRGRVEVAGIDVRTRADDVRSQIGLLGQNAAVDEELSGRQNLEMFGRLYHLGARRAGARADELLEQFGLTETGTKAVKQYSGGMRRRLDLAASLISQPQVLFLDEPTTGLDPRGRTEVWNAVRSLVGGGTTVLLTTQYLEEADQLADQIAVINRGQVIAEGTADELKTKTGGDRIDVILHDVAQLERAAALLPGDVDKDEDRRMVSASISNRMAALTETVRALQEAASRRRTSPCVGRPSTRSSCT
ncbi:ATP-binding cassette domain-containing protein [Actinomadura keratinilytica]